MPGAVIAVDAGTTGVRAFAVDELGAPLGYAYQEFPQYFPHPGWVEHDADEIWSAVEATLADLRARLDRPIAAVGITDQRETTVVWDKRTGRPRHRAIVWQDRRTADRCRQLEEAGHLPLVREQTGLVLDPYFSATKLEWLLTEGGVEADDDLAFGTVDSWVLWNLTGGSEGGVHATDPSNASRTMLYDIRRRQWSDELCDLFGVPRSCLPAVHPSSGRFGRMADGTPVSGIAGDQQAALFGQGCFQPGDAKNTYGTGSFVLLNVGPACPPPVEGLLTTVAWVLGDGTVAYALEGAIFVTGAAVQWLRDGLGIIGDAADSEALARTVDDTEGVYVVPAFTGLGSPYWDPYARGTIVGLTRGVGRGHLARAVVESMAYQTRDVIDAMREAWRAFAPPPSELSAAEGGSSTGRRPMQEVAGRGVSRLRADGGASANDLLLQLQADQLQVPVVRSAVQETTALGAAYLAGLAEGVWSSTEEVAGHWRAAAEFAPAVPASVAESRYAAWRRAVDRSRDWARREGT
ncbi:MAG: glycerol kinase GlpK [Acidimicrobiia bacterium]|nr:glycerol kinase GlpK [Acidimicrobiia bacterium]